MIAAERRRRILEQIRVRGVATVDELSERFAVSEMTIRRDLSALEQEGVLHRTHGGATAVQDGYVEPLFSARRRDQAREKEQIGRLAAELVHPGDSIFMDIGTTTLQMARHLKQKPGLKVVTNSVQVGVELTKGTNVAVVLVGGILRQDELSMLGSLAERSLQDLFVDKAFIGVGGLHWERGLTDYNLEEIEVKKVAMNHARHIVVLADHSKFDRVALSPFAPISSVQTVVTDKNTSEQQLQYLADMGIEVVTPVGRRGRAS